MCALRVQASNPILSIKPTFYTCYFGSQMLSSCALALPLEPILGLEGICAMCQGQHDTIILLQQLLTLDKCSAGSMSQ